MSAPPGREDLYQARTAIPALCAKAGVHTVDVRGTSPTRSTGYRSAVELHYGLFEVTAVLVHAPGAGLCDGPCAVEITATLMLENSLAVILRTLFSRQECGTVE